jgi:hypothetical protein
MRPTSILAGIALLFTVEVALAQKPATTAQPNGELIYKTYCIGCHTTEVHWREKRLATDWASLKFQVRRFLDNNGIALSEGEVTALTGFLNRRYYKFANPIAGYERVGPVGCRNEESARCSIRVDLAVPIPRTTDSFQPALALR